MTNPYDPTNNEPSDENFNPYPPSQHPEDRPDFGKRPYSDTSGSLPQYGDYSSTPNNDTAGQGYGAYPQSSGYNNYNQYGDQSQAGGIHPTTGWRMHQGEPTGVPIGTAISYGFKETFKNGLIWILGTLVFLIVSIIVSFIEDFLSRSIGGGVSISIFSSLLSLAVGVCAYRLAFNGVDGKNLSIGDSVKGYSFFRAILVAILAGLLSFLAMTPGLVLLVSSVSDLLLAADTLPADADPDYVMSLVNWGGMFGGIILMLLGGALIAPFVSLIQLFPIDRNTSVGESFKLGFKAVGSNYLALLGYFIVIMLITFVIVIFTLGFGVIIALPFMINATAYVFRSVTGGVRPVNN